MSAQVASNRRSSYIKTCSLPIQIFSKLHWTRSGRKQESVPLLWRSLEEDDPEMFCLFYQFLYTGQIFSIRDGGVQEKPGVASDEEWIRLGNAWILGEKLLSSSFKDSVTDSIIAKMQEKRRFPSTIHETIYPKSNASSAIRKLIVDIAICNPTAINSPEKQFDIQWAEYYYDCMGALNRAQTFGRTGEVPYLGENTCWYHEHGTDKPCYKTVQF